MLTVRLKNTIILSTWIVQLPLCSKFDCAISFARQESARDYQLLKVQRRVTSLFSQLFFISTRNRFLSRVISAFRACLMESLSDRLRRRNSWSSCPRAATWPTSSRSTTSTKTAASVSMSFTWRSVSYTVSFSCLTLSLLTRSLCSSKYH